MKTIKLNALVITPMILTSSCQKIPCNNPPPASKQIENTTTTGKTAIDNYQVLDRAPAWTELSGDPDEARRLVDACRQIAKSDTQQIRSMLVDFCDEKNGKDAGGMNVDQMSKVYVLNRILFAIPATVEAQDIRYFGSWVLPDDVADSGNNLIWPVTPLANGSFEIVGEFKGYFGAAYTPIREFDYLYEHFGRR